MSRCAITILRRLLYCCALVQFLERLKSGLSLLEDPRLVIRLHEKYLSWSKAAPILLSIMLFRQPLPPDVVEEMVKDGLDVNVNLSAEEVKGVEGVRGKKSWFGWSWGTTEANTSQAGAVEVDKVKLEVVEGLPGVEEVASEEEEREEVKEEEEEGGQRCRKTLRLSSDRLVDLNLRPGSNEVEFSVTTAFQVCNIYRGFVSLIDIVFPGHNSVQVPHLPLEAHRQGPTFANQICCIMLHHM